MTTIETTAAELAVALWEHYSWFRGVEDLSRGTYPGTEIPVRKVPADAPVVLKAWRGGGKGVTCLDHLTRKKIVGPH